MVNRVDPRREPGSMRPDPDDAAKARRIGAELARLRYVLPGSVSARYTRCGRGGCRCMADPPRPHGPYWWWTRKVNAKTVTKILTDDQYADYRPWFDNARRAKELLAELEALSLAKVEADPRSTRRDRGSAKPAAVASRPKAKPAQGARSRRR